MTALRSLRRNPLCEEVGHRLEVDLTVCGGGGAGIAEDAILGQCGHPLGEDDLADGLIEGADVPCLGVIHPHEIGPEEEIERGFALARVRAGDLGRNIERRRDAIEHTDEADQVREGDRFRAAEVVG